jgi:ribosomal protein S18 acetylase RimI-like enzyme
LSDPVPEQTPEQKGHSVALTTAQDPGATRTADSHPLDHPVWASLTGAHAQFAEGEGRARRYRTRISPFAALHPESDAAAWADLRALFGPSQVVSLAGSDAMFATAPDGWSVPNRLPGLQLISTEALQSRPDGEAVLLGEADAAEMVDLVARTEPGPFREETYRLGTYLGLRSEGRLIAMAGERMRPPGFTEISAVCTDPEFRRQGLAARLVRAVAHGIRERGETPFLHTAARNASAIRLYLAMGFEVRRQVTFGAVRTPAD